MRLLLPSLLLLSAPALAQPTLSSAVLPVAGTTLQYGRTTAVPPGASGANVTWDFSTMTVGIASPITVEACPATAGCSTFPGSDVKLTDNSVGGGTIGYYVGNSNVFSLNGLTTTGVNYVYTNPEDFLRFPMTYNTPFTDNFRNTYAGVGGMYTRTGTVTVVADGWGTLILPAGTVNNVMRVKRTSNFVDSLNGMQDSIYNTTLYSWYSPVYQGNLMDISQVIAFGATITFTTFRTSLTTGVGGMREESKFSISPNPVQDRLTVRWAAGAEATLALQDLAGRTVKQTTGRDDATIMVDDLPRGMYLLRVVDATGVASTQKVSLR